MEDIILRIQALVDPASNRSVEALIARNKELLKVLKSIPDEADDAFKELAREFGRGEDAVQDFENQLESLREEYRRNNQEIREFNRNIRDRTGRDRSINQLRTQLRRVNQELDQVGRNTSEFRRLSAEARRLNRELSETERRAGRAGSSLRGAGPGRLFGGIGQAASRLTGPLIAVGAAIAGVRQVLVPIVDASKEFEAAISGVQAIVQGTDEDLQRLSDTALELGASTAFSAVSAAKGMEELARAGLTVDEVISAIPATLDLAQATSITLAEASRITAQSLRAFSLDAAEAGRATDTAAAVAATANTNITDYSEALKQIGPIANTLGIELEEAGAAIGILADNGLRGTEATTSLTTAFARISAGIPAAVDELERLGVEAFDQQGNFVGLANFIRDLEGALEGATQQQRLATTSLVFGNRSIRQANILLNSQKTVISETGVEILKGGEALAGYTEQIEAATAGNGAYTESIAEIQLDNLRGDVVILESALKNFAIQLGDFVNPTFRAFVQFATEAVTVAAEFLGFTTASTEGIEKQNAETLSLTLQIRDLVEEEKQLQTELANTTAESEEGQAALRRLNEVQAEQRVSLQQLNDIAPDVAAAINLETTSFEQLNGVIRETNITFQESLQLARQRAALTLVEEERADLIQDQARTERDLRRQLIEFNQEYEDSNIDVTASLGDQIAQYFEFIRATSAYGVTVIQTTRAVQGYIRATADAQQNVERLDEEAANYRREIERSTPAIQRLNGELDRLNELSDVTLESTLAVDTGGLRVQRQETLSLLQSVEDVQTQAREERKSLLEEEDSDERRIREGQLQRIITITETQAKELDKRKDAIDDFLQLSEQEREASFRRQIDDTASFNKAERKAFDKQQKELATERSKIAEEARKALNELAQDSLQLINEAEERERQLLLERLNRVQATEEQRNALLAQLEQRFIDERREFFERESQEAQELAQARALEAAERIDNFGSILAQETDAQIADEQNRISNRILAAESQFDDLLENAETARQQRLATINSDRAQALIDEEAFQTEQAQIQADFLREVQNIELQRAREVQRIRAASQEELVRIEEAGFAEQQVVIDLARDNLIAEQEDIARIRLQEQENLLANQSINEQQYTAEVIRILNERQDAVNEVEDEIAQRRIERLQERTSELIALEQERVRAESAALATDVRIDISGQIDVDTSQLEGITGVLAEQQANLEEGLAEIRRQSAQNLTAILEEELELRRQLIERDRLNRLETAQENEAELQQLTQQAALNRIQAIATVANEEVELDADTFDTLLGQVEGVLAQITNQRVKAEQEVAALGSTYGDFGLSAAQRASVQNALSEIQGIFDSSNRSLQSSLEQDSEQIETILSTYDIPDEVVEDIRTKSLAIATSINELEDSLSDELQTLGIDPDSIAESATQIQRLADNLQQYTSLQSEVESTGAALNTTLDQLGLQTEDLDAFSESLEQLVAQVTSGDLDVSSGAESLGQVVANFFDFDSIDIPPDTKDQLINQITNLLQAVADEAEFDAGEFAIPIQAILDVEEFRAGATEIVEGIQSEFNTLDISDETRDRVTEKLRDFETVFRAGIEGITDGLQIDEDEVNTFVESLQLDADTSSFIEQTLNEVVNSYRQSVEAINSISSQDLADLLGVEESVISTDFLTAFNQAFERLAQQRVAITANSAEERVRINQRALDEEAAAEEDFAEKVLDLREQANDAFALSVESRLAVLRAGAENFTIDRTRVTDQLDELRDQTISRVQELTDILNNTGDEVDPKILENYSSELELLLKVLEDIQKAADDLNLSGLSRLFETEEVRRYTEALQATAGVFTGFSSAVEDGIQRQREALEAIGPTDEEINQLLEQREQTLIAQGATTEEIKEDLKEFREEQESLRLTEAEILEQLKERIELRDTLASIEQRITGVLELQNAIKQTSQAIDEARDAFDEIRARNEARRSAERLAQDTAEIGTSGFLAILRNAAAGVGAVLGIVAAIGAAALALRTLFGRNQNQFQAEGGGLVEEIPFMESGGQVKPLGVRNRFRTGFQNSRNRTAVRIQQFAQGGVSNPSGTTRVLANKQRTRVVTPSSRILKSKPGTVLQGKSHAAGGVLLEAERGEYIVNRRSSAAYLPQIDYINRMGRYSPNMTFPAHLFPHSTSTKPYAMPVGPPARAGNYAQTGGITGDSASISVDVDFSAMEAQLAELIDRTAENTEAIRNIELVVDNNEINRLNRLDKKLRSGT